MQFLLHNNKLGFGGKQNAKESAQKILYIYRERIEFVCLFHAGPFLCWAKALYAQHNKFSPFIYNGILLNAINLIKFLLPVDAVLPLSGYIAYIIVFIYICVRWLLDVGYGCVFLSVSPTPHTLYLRVKLYPSSFEIHKRWKNFRCL